MSESQVVDDIESLRPMDVKLANDSEEEENDMSSMIEIPILAEDLIFCLE